MTADPENRVPPLPVYILAGGKSRRFGSDKARAQLAGRPLIQRIAAAAEPAAASITVVADVPDKYSDLGLSTIADHTPHLGPVGGLHTALTHLRDHQAHRRLLLLSCDLVELPGDWPASLLNRADVATPVVAYRGPRWEPLLALYSVSILPAVSKYIGDGGRAMWRLLDTLHAAPVPLPAEMPRLKQINTASDHQEFTNPPHQ